MKYKIKHQQDSVTGLVRENNEDNNINLELAKYPNLLVLGAIDGVGGYEGGEIAAETCKTIVEAYFIENQDKLQGAELEHTLRALHTANNRIYQERLEQEHLSKMSCVASMALLDSHTERLYFAHVGDSRAYIYREGDLIKLTNDHSLVGYLEEIGEISEEEAMNHPRRNQISKLMGEKFLEFESKYIQSGEHSFYSKDIALFCSDGLTDLVTKAEIIEVLSNQNLDLEAKMKALIQCANDNGGKDNITVALAEYQKGKVVKKVSEEEAISIDIAAGTESIDVEKDVTQDKQKNTYLMGLFIFFIAVILGLLGYLFLTGSETSDESKLSVDKETQELPVDTIQVVLRKEPVIRIVTGSIITQDQNGTILNTEQQGSDTIVSYQTIEETRILYPWEHKDIFNKTNFDKN